MNDLFDHDIAALLHEQADVATRALDVDEAARKMETRFDEIDRDRRRRSWTTVAVVAAVAAAMVLALVLAGRPADRSLPQPVKPPAPSIPGGEVLNAHPFLRQQMDRIPPDLPLWLEPLPSTSRPLPLHRCIDPSHWGAAIARAASWADPHPERRPETADARVNEFLLQYADAPSAHRGFLAAARQFARCVPTPADPHPEAVVGRPDDRSLNIAETFEGQSSTIAIADRRRVVYALLMARSGNVLIVEEDTGFPSDRAGCRLDIATVRALLPDDDLPLPCNY